MIRHILFGAWLALLFVLPIPLGSNRPWIWTLELAGCSLLAAALFFQSARGQWRANSVWQGTQLIRGLALAWLGYHLIQLLPMPGLDSVTGSISTDRGTTWAATLETLFYLLMFFLCIALVDTRKRLAWTLATIVVAGTLQAIYGSMMTLTGVEWGIGEKSVGRGLATGTFVNRNHFAGYLELSLAAGIGLLVSQMGHGTTHDSARAWLRDWAKILLGPKALLRLSLVVMVIALVLSRSRMGNTAFFAATLITGVAALVLLRSPPRSLVILIVSLIVVDVAIIGTWFGVEKVVDRISTTGQFQPETGRYMDEDRLDVDIETIAAWRDYQWLGSGGGTFETVFNRYRPADLKNQFDHAHNDYLEILLEYGIVGSAILGGWVLLIAVRTVTALRTRRRRLLTGAAFATIMAMVSIAIHATVDFNLRIPANAATLCVMLGCGLIAGLLESGADRRQHMSDTHL